ncbi:domain of Kin17 curved DNA-binding protein-domain-containing protein [Myxozyma melibiosi]|uniref:Domain of Kin17 curved DNA-binding protein-domain-containing protein n=1 Tax=Myxozyma melibiosi TaxID=54550 RepID=A0ABR1F7E2_9ASCO
MGRAEVGTPKYIANKMKSKGLQRLRWYCQVCEKQCRDENGFRCHTQSEAHVRQMIIIGENPQKKISEFTQQFVRDFIALLRSSHGEKKINANKFYQEYIADRNHVHMNATRFVSLSEFVKYLENEGVCKVEVDEKSREGGFTIAYIDNSPEAIKRREIAQKRERSGDDDLERERRFLAEQIKRAQEEQEKKKESESNSNSGSEEVNKQATKELQREGEQPIKIGFSLGGGKASGLAKRAPAVPLNRPKKLLKMK